MKKIWARFYAIYSATGFFVIFLFLFPFFLLILHNPRKHHYAYWLNKIWAWGAFAWAFLRVKKIQKAPIPRCPVVYVANHTSFLDIPLIGYAVDRFVVFMGKASLSKVPVFGYMFRKLHISVERESLKGSLQSIDKAIDTIKMGYSLGVFPEGSMKNPHPPKLCRFKDGAFRIAILTQSPVVPITLHNNWQLLYAYSGLMFPGCARITLHEPIFTQGMTLDDVERLKMQVFEIIENSLTEPQKVV